VPLPLSGLIVNQLDAFRAPFPETPRELPPRELPATAGGWREILADLNPKANESTKLEGNRPAGRKNT
jgi:hypothetical protein